MLFYFLFIPLIKLSLINSYTSMDRGLDSILDDLERISWFDYEKREIKHEPVYKNKIELYIDEDDITEIKRDIMDDSNKYYYINNNEDNQGLMEFEELEKECETQEKSEFLIDLFLYKRIKTLNLPNELKFVEAINLTYRSFLNFFANFNPKDEDVIDFIIETNEKLRNIIILFYKKMCYDSKMKIGNFYNTIFNDCSLLDVIEKIINLLKGRESQGEIVNQFKTIIIDLKNCKNLQDIMKAYVYLYGLIYYNYFVTKEAFNFRNKTDMFFRICNNMNIFLENLFYCIEVKIKECLSNCLYSMKLSDKLINTSFIHDKNEKNLYHNVNDVFKIVYEILSNDEN